MQGALGVLSVVLPGFGISVLAHRKITANTATETSVIMGPFLVIFSFPYRLLNDQM